MSGIYALMDTLLPFEWLHYTFMKNALIAILLLTPLFGMLGTMAVDNKMAFFSDALGHSALTGIAIGVVLGWQSQMSAMLLFGILWAVLITFVKHHSKMSADTIISVFSSTSIALGLVVLSRGGAFAKYSSVLVGDVLSGSIAMSAIALPEMRNNRYDDTLAVGTLACSSTIGALIPPSTTFILYGVLAEQSIADLFMAGVFPGLICTFFFMLVIWVMVFRRPELAPRLPKEPLAVRLASLRAAFPIIALFVLVIGGIYGGMFTPTEGGGIGAAGTLILALLLRRMTWKSFMESLSSSARFITMCFTVLTGATALGAFMTLSRIPQLLAGAIASTGMPGWLTMCAIIVVLLFLGCFIPAMPLLLVCVPIFVPIAHVYDWDLIWFGVIMALMMNMAGITPPFGINLFVMKGLADVPLSVMYRSSVPFVIALAISILVVLAFPSTATWLPAALR